MKTRERRLCLFSNSNFLRERKKEAGFTQLTLVQLICDGMFRLETPRGFSLSKHNLTCALTLDFSLFVGIS